MEEKDDTGEVECLDISRFESSRQHLHLRKPQVRIGEVDGFHGLNRKRFFLLKSIEYRVRRVHLSEGRKKVRTSN